MCKQHILKSWHRFIVGVVQLCGTVVVPGMRVWLNEYRGRSARRPEGAIMLLHTSPNSLHPPHIYHH